MPRLKNRSGFALPLAILVIAILTAAIAAGLAATTTETTTTTARLGQTRAYAVAEAGLERFMSTRAALCSQAGSLCVADPLKPGQDTERVRVRAAGGFADVVVVKLRDSTTIGGVKYPAVFFLRSRGVDTTRSVLGGGVRDSAERTVGIYATFNAQTINIMAAITSLTGVTKQGTAGIVDGNDACGQASAVAGLTTAKGDYQVSGNFQPSGNPPVDTSKTTSQLQSSVGIDWGAVRNGAIAADYTVPPDAFPTLAWFQADTTRWPVIHITSSSFSLPNPGRGLLIVDGDFDVNGSNMWSGVVLIGGKLTSNGYNTMSGAIVSGLNSLLGMSVDASVVNSDNSSLNGYKDYLYNSCSVNMATNGLRGYKPIPNTWMDNVASW